MPPEHILTAHKADQLNDEIKQHTRDADLESLVESAANKTLLSGHVIEPAASSFTPPCTPPLSPLANIVSSPPPCTHDPADSVAESILDPSLPQYIPRFSSSGIDVATSDVLPSCGANVDTSIPASSVHPAAAALTTDLENFTTEGLGSSSLAEWQSNSEALITKFILYFNRMVQHIAAEKIDVVRRVSDESTEPIPDDHLSLQPYLIEKIHELDSQLDHLACSFPINSVVRSAWCDAATL